MTPLNITHVTSEFNPLAKAGGLADVVHGLAKQQVLNGNNVSVILPKYDLINFTLVNPLEIYLQDLWTYQDNKANQNIVYKTIYEGINIFFIEPNKQRNYFNQGVIYGAENDAERFLYFSRAAVEFLNHENQPLNILHLHDWPTAVIAPLIKCMFRGLSGRINSIIFTIHNIEHQGRIHPNELSRIGLYGANLLTDPNKPEYLNLMKGGIAYADKVTTVSPTYAKEIKTPEFSFGLDKTIDQYKDKLFGVINGIEQESWNPATDPHLFEPFPSNGTYIQDILRKKDLNKQALFKELGMNPSNGGPLVICITRLASQKGPELILKAISLITRKGGCFILLGSICEKNLEKPFNQAKEEFKNNPNVFLCYQFDNGLAHKLFAAADAIFIPSKFEPCGLTQMIAMHYGTIPIARNTGGLKDTINDSTSKDPSGFLFDELSEVGVDKILDTAFNLYFYDKAKWQTMIQNGIGKDYSWKLPSISYEHIYRNEVLKQQCSRN